MSRQEAGTCIACILCGTIFSCCLPLSFINCHTLTFVRSTALPVVYISSIAGVNNGNNPPDRDSGSETPSATIQTANQEQAREWFHRNYSNSR